MFPKIGGKTPKWMVYNGKPENLIKIDDLWGTPIFGNTHLSTAAGFLPSVFVYIFALSWMWWVMWVETRFFIIQHLPFKVKLKNHCFIHLTIFNDVIDVWYPFPAFFEKHKLPMSPQKKRFMIESNESGGKKTCSKPSFDCFPDILHTNICIPRRGQRLAIESFLGASNSEMVGGLETSSTTLVGGLNHPFEKYARQNGNLPQVSGWTWKIFELPPPSTKSMLKKCLGYGVSLHQAQSFLGCFFLVTGKFSSSLLHISFGNLWLITKPPYFLMSEESLRNHSLLITSTAPVLLLSFMDRILLQLRYMEHCWTSS